METNVKGKSAGKDLSQGPSQRLPSSFSPYQPIFDSLNEGIWFTDTDGLITYSNINIAAMLGYAAEEMAGKPFTSFMEEQCRKDGARLIQKGKSGIKASSEIKFMRKDGTSMWAELAAGSIPDSKGNPPGIIIGVQDITARKQALEELRLSEERYRLLVDNASEAIMVAQDGKFKFVNFTLCEMMGYSSEELLAMPSFADLIHPEDREMVIDRYKRRITGESLPSTYLFRVIGKGNVEKWTQSNAIMINWEGQPATLNFFTEITERKQAEQALLDSEEKYRALVENAYEAIYIIEKDQITQKGRLTFFNPVLLTMSGYTSQELLDMDFTQLVHPDDLTRIRNIFTVGWSGPEDSWNFSLRFIHKNGEIRWAEVHLVKINWGGHPAALNFATDITDKKRAEEERRSLEQKAQTASRLASVGEMASGIAHEINNPLTGVIGYAQLLLREDLPEKIKKDLKIIDDGAQRVADIVNRLLAFARQQKPERTIVDVNDIIQNTLLLRNYHLKTSNIEVSTRLDPALPATLADRGQIQQVFLNLIANAETEMKLAHNKGTLEITTRLVNNYVSVYFKDDGPGIEPENIEKIFDPFFTTRDVGQGTGLGLSICHGIISEHNGHIYAQSKPGKGSTFVVELPIISKAPVSDELAEEDGDKKDMGRARILVVDDEQVILQFLNRVLRAEGHDVETVDSAAAALEMIQKKRYSLILLDIKMPGISGIEFYRQLEKIARSLANRVVFMTGDVMGIDTKEFLETTGAPFINKPFDISKLRHQVDQVLSER
ncbi:MAG: PAS domain S-box protein [Dehalococcoidia bacterium]|nr:PAS domain S-box protein [Dehalococcoidia bacterium]MDD5494261.1 PAS domain S-box protein [Dehalococcoidia bacterium]